MGKGFLKTRRRSIVVSRRLIPMGRRFLKMRRRSIVVSGRLLTMRKRFLTMGERPEVVSGRLIMIGGRLLTMSKRLLMMRKRSDNAIEPSIAITTRRSTTRNRALAKNRRRLCRFIALRRGIAIRARTVSVKATKARQWALAGWAFMTTKKETVMASNKDKTVNQHRQGIAGIRKHFASVPTILLGGTPTTPNDATATLQGTIDAVDAADAAEQAFHSAVAAQNAAIAKGTGLLTDLKTLVKSQLGSSEGVLGDFGFSNPKRQTPDEATKAAAVVKRAATREARHTMGKRQKAGIKGTVPATTASVAASGTSSSGAAPASPVVPAANTATAPRS
jgi:hypothetical protein